MNFSFAIGVFAPLKALKLRFIFQVNGDGAQKSGSKFNLLRYFVFMRYYKRRGTEEEEVPAEIAIVGVPS